jgi:hypothetical protein
LLAVGLGVYLVETLAAPAWLLGPLLAIDTMAGALRQGVMVRRTAGWSRDRVLLLAGALWAGWGLAALEGASAAVVVPGLVVAMLLYSLAELLHAPRSMGLATELAPTAHRATYLAWFQYSFAVATTAAPGVFAVSFAADTRLPWLVTTAVAAAACLGVIVVGRQMCRPG